MKSNIIIIIVAIVVIFLVFKMMKTIKAQSELMQAQSDVLMAVAIQTGAVKQKSKERGRIAAPNKANKDEDEPFIRAKKNVKLSAIQKRFMKLFDDETPKTAGQIRESYNKSNSDKVDAKKTNSILWNMKENKGVITCEKLEDSDSIWGPVEWFESDGRMMEEFFKKAKS